MYQRQLYLFLFLTYWRIASNTLLISPLFSGSKCENVKCVDWWFISGFPILFKIKLLGMTLYTQVFCQRKPQMSARSRALSLFCLDSPSFLPDHLAPLRRYSGLIKQITTQEAEGTQVKEVGAHYAATAVVWVTKPILSMFGLVFNVFAVFKFSIWFIVLILCHS